MAASILGVDVSKASFDCFDTATEESSRIPARDLPAWSARLQARPDTLVVFEATGVYSKRLARVLEAAGIAFAEVNPRQVRRFAQACGTLAKNDRLDAKVIARYGMVLKPRATRLQADEKLRALVVRREQLLAMMQAEKGHRETCDDPAIAAAIHAHLATLKAQLAGLQKQLAAAMREDARASLLLSMPGVGDNVAAGLLAHMPELGTLNRAQAAALAGLAPYVRDSGSFRGKRSIYGGRPQIRRLLYMAALVASRHNPTYRLRYEALRRNGKPFKVAITAIMRHMLITLNAMCRQNQSWRQ